jgi:dihydromethanopterin reductase
LNGIFAPVKRGRLVLCEEKQLADIRVICAIGQRGQLGLDGRLPWEGNSEPDYVADVARFFELSRGHVLLVGPRTYASIPAFAFEDRTIVEIRSSMRPQDIIARYRDRVIIVGGGPPVYAAYAPLIRHWDINRLPYDGDADRWFDPRWLVAAAAV